MITPAGSANGHLDLASERELLCTADASGHLTSVNADWERVVGWRADELTAKPLADFVHPDDRQETVAAIARATKPGGGAVEIEHRFRARGGGWRWLRTRIQNDGDSWLARAIDVTDERRETDQLRAALSDDRLVAHGQPIVEPNSGALVQEELLVRMRAPENPGQVLTPAEFLPRAERLGLASLVDRRMVSLGLEMATRGRRTAVNLSARSIPDPAFMAEVEHAVEYVGRYAPNLVFEITETAALEELDAVAAFAQRLNALGVWFALDDFGTGYGSLTELRTLPIQFLKIDGLFVQNALASERDRAMVSGIVALARPLGIRTVAEGIEDAATLGLMNACGVDYAQGFFLGAPGPLENHAKDRSRDLSRESTVMVPRAPRVAGPGSSASGRLPFSRRRRRFRGVGPWGLAAAAAAGAICVLLVLLALGGSGGGGPGAHSSSDRPAGERQFRVPNQNYVPPGIFGGPLGSKRR